MPDLIDTETPQQVDTRTGFDGQSYELIFSDKLNTPRTDALSPRRSLAFIFPPLLSAHIPFIIQATIRREHLVPHREQPRELCLQPEVEIRKLEPENR